MKPTTKINDNYRLAVDIKDLALMLGVGTATARKLADECGASFCLGRRRLYNIRKIQEYINTLSNE